MRGGLIKNYTRGYMQKVLGIIGLIGVVAFASNVAAKEVSKEAAFANDSDPYVDHFPKRLVPGQLLLKLKGKNHRDLPIAIDQSDEAKAFAALLDNIGASAKVYLQFQRRMQFGWFLVEVRNLEGRRPTELQTEAIATLLNKHPALDYAELNLWRRPLLRPNDSFVQSMWPFTSLGAESAWELTTGESSQRIGVVDTGTHRIHEDLIGKDVAGYDFIRTASRANDGDGRDANYQDAGDAATGCPNGGDRRENSWHGTHVAGTILATTDNNIGIAGLNWNAQLVTGRALGKCGGDNVDILDAMAWLAGFSVDGAPAIGDNVVSVINLSLGSEGQCDRASASFVSNIVGAGVVVVAASGNERSRSAISNPANCEGALSVAAHGDGSNRPLTGYSNFTSQVDVVAPGGNLRNGQQGGVISAIGPASNDYAFFEGTSMATPHVAGVVSLMQAVSPNATPDQLLSILKSTAENCSGCGSVGAVRMDLAVAEAGGFDPPPPPEPNFGESFCSGGSCQGSLECLTTGDDTPRECFRPCSTASDCDAGFQCIETNVDSFNICIQTGEGSVGDACSRSYDCGEGLRCIENQCTERCALGYSCSSAQQTCDNGICQGTPIGEGEGEGEPGEGEGEGEAGTCSEARGNWDCQSGFECSGGQCLPVVSEGAFVGELCTDDSDCRGGLCDRGVCTKPCDYSCEDGYVCDQEAIPGGLCKAESCAASEGKICQDDWWCTYTEAQRYVCARDGDDLYGSFFCSHSRVTSSAAPLSLGFLLLCLALVRRKSGRQ